MTPQGFGEGRRLLLKSCRNRDAVAGNWIFDSQPLSCYFLSSRWKKIEQQTGVLQKWVTICSIEGDGCQNRKRKRKKKECSRGRCGRKKKNTPPPPKVVEQPISVKNEGLDRVVATGKYDGRNGGGGGGLRRR
ncbi:hypothetical protein CDAR_500891 [Caerostris darwini]|uniref:Uncharacterized protein n=1 Tax=Caerostris darwini TaxID=1538125 RepID=A0AAV4NI02_9ARAC|nr:hypothetical protein CDAR_500891 [Caerostris darwini]